MIVTTPFSSAINNWLDVKFSQYKGKFRAVSDTKAYRKKEDVSVWGQWKGHVPESSDIYLEVSPDRWEYVCDIQADTGKAEAELRVTNGLVRIKNQLEKEYKQKNKG